MSTSRGPTNGCFQKPWSEIQDKPTGPRLGRQPHVLPGPCWYSREARRWGREGASLRQLQKILPSPSCKAGFLLKQKQGEGNGRFRSSAIPARQVPPRLGRRTNIKKVLQMVLSQSLIWTTLSLKAMLGLGIILEIPYVWLLVIRHLPSLLPRHEH